MARATGTPTGAERYAELSPASRGLWQRALESFPGGSSRTTTFQDPHPLFLASGSGCRVTDADGVERIDFISNYTSLIHGHCHPRVVEAVQRQAGRLASAAGPSELELALAERLRERLPSLELVRFANSGTEATLQAVRAARAYTGRSALLTFAGAYHGTHEWAVAIPAEASAPAGDRSVPAAVAEGLLVAPYNDAEAARAVVESRAGDLAAIVVEPVLGAGGVVPADEAFLRALRGLADETGALLVFDEVIAFRIGYHGAQGRYGVTPDLTTLGKIIGGGLPVGAFGGRAEVMTLFDARSPDALTHGGTFNGNPLTMAAGLAALEELPPGALARLEELTTTLVERLRRVLADAGREATVTQAGSLFNVHLTPGPIRDHADVRAGDREGVRRLHLAMLGHGILWTPRGMGCLSTPMTEAEVDAFAGGLERSLEEVA